MHIALRIQADFKHVIMGNSFKVLDEVLNCLMYSPFYMDVKLSIVHTFLPKIQFYHVDKLVTIMQTLIARCQQVDGILVCNINPFQVASAILSIFHKLKN